MRLIIHHFFKGEVNINQFLTNNYKININYSIIFDIEIYISFIGALYSHPRKEWIYVYCLSLDSC